MTNQLIKYKHHCSSCINLGSFFTNNKNYDLYFCKTEKTSPVLYARYGNFPNEVIEGILTAKFYLQDFLEAYPETQLSNIEILRSINVLNKKAVFEAAARAIEQNLIDENLFSASIYRPYRKI